MRTVIIPLLLIFLSASLNCDVARAALPPEVRRELSGMQREIRDIAPLIRRNQIDEAMAVVQKIEDRLAELMIAEDESDRAYTQLKLQLEKAKAAFPVSFEQSVAPILTASCVRCHGAERPRASLRLDTYNAMARGGRSGPLLIPGRPLQSHLMVRLLADNEQQRMPRDADRLDAADIALIARWIEQGAGFDGENRDAPIGDSTVVKKPPVTVVMADGSETVSFTRDLAPWMVNICLGCHSGNNPRGSFNISTFEQLLSGGNSGSTIVPGRPDESYIVDLVLRQQPLKMPAGQAQLKRSQAVALETWIREGARFDGTNAKATIRSLVPTEAEMQAARLAAMSEEELRSRRLEQAGELWKRVSPRTEGTTVTSKHLILHGNLPESRLTEMSSWGESQVEKLMDTYRLSEGSVPWRGGLIVFVGRDRFDYEEFNTVLMNGRRTPRSVSGHVVVTRNSGTAYVALHDTGDTSSTDSLPARQLLNALIAEAYLDRRGTALPDWLRQGFGMLEAEIPAGSDILKSFPMRASRALSTVSAPERIFEDGTFAPDEVGVVGYLLVRFLQRNGGNEKLGQLVSELQSSSDVSRAVQQTYGTSAAALGQTFVRTGLR